jgi:hypothetical protein
VIAEPGDIPPSVLKDATYDQAMVAALHCFAEKGEVGYATALLTKHPTIAGHRLTRPPLRKPQHDDEYTALHKAARAGQSRMARLLVEFEANVDADGGNAWTPLHVAAKHGHLHVVKVLIELGADVRAMTDALPARPAPGGPAGTQPVMLPPIPSQSPLDVAKEYNQKAVVEYLMRP